MRWYAVFFGVVAAATVIAGLLPAQAQRSNPLPPRVEIEYTYEVPSDRRLMPIYDRLTDKDVFAQLEKYLSPLRLPRKISLRTKQCGEGRIKQNYKSGADLVLCYEYLARVDNLIHDSKITSPILREAMGTGTVAHALLRMVALDIFDQLQLPVWGRAEDAADRLASFLMLRFGPPDKAEEWYGGAGVYFAVSGKAERVNFAELTSPDFQRFFNHLCFAKAAGDDKYFELASAWTPVVMKPEETAELRKVFDIGKLPAEQQGPALKQLNLEQGVFTSFFFKRIVGYCGKEYGEVERAFRQELLPYIDRSALTAAQRSKL